MRFTYSGPCAVGVVTSQDAVGVTNCGGPALVPQSNEHYLSVTVTDLTGQDVTFMYEEDGANQSAFCGHARDLPVEPGGSIQLMPLAGVTGTTCALPPTQGTVTVTLTNYR